jgi:hypothetical protein
MSNRAIAHRLGVSEKAIRKLVGPSKPAESAQLGFAAIATAAAAMPPAPHAPSEKSTGDAADRAAPLADDGTGDCAAPAGRARLEDTAAMTAKSIKHKFVTALGDGADAT